MIKIDSATTTNTESNDEDEEENRNHIQENHVQQRRSKYIKNVPTGRGLGRRLAQKGKSSLKSNFFASIRRHDVSGVLKKLRVRSFQLKKGPTSAQLQN